MLDRAQQNGQALLLALPLLAAVSLSVLMIWDSGQIIRAKSGAQRAADATAYSVAVLGARQKNFTAYINRAIIANEVSIGQFASLATWARRYARSSKHAQLNPKYQIPIPVAPGTVGGLMARILQPYSTAGQAFERATEPLAKSGTKVLGGFNQFLAMFSRVFNFGTIQSQLELAGIPERGGVNLVKANFDRADLSAAGNVLLPLSMWYQQLHLQKPADETDLMYMAGLVDRNRGEVIKNRSADSLKMGNRVLVPIFPIVAEISFDFGFGFGGGSEYRMFGQGRLDESRFSQSIEKKRKDKKKKKIKDDAKQHADTGGGRLQFAWTSADSLASEIDIAITLHIPTPVGIKREKIIDVGVADGIGGDALQYKIKSGLGGRSHGPEKGGKLIKGPSNPLLTPIGWGQKTTIDARQELYGGMWWPPIIGESVGTFAIGPMTPPPFSAFGTERGLESKGLPRFLSFESDLWKRREPLLPYVIAVEVASKEVEGSNALVNGQDGDRLFGYRENPIGLGKAGNSLHAVAASETYFAHPDHRVRANEFMPYWDARNIEPNGKVMTVVKNMPMVEEHARDIVGTVVDAVEDGIRGLKNYAGRLL